MVVNVARVSNTSITSTQRVKLTSISCITILPNGSRKIGKALVDNITIVQPPAIWPSGEQPGTPLKAKPTALVNKCMFPGHSSIQRPKAHPRFDWHSKEAMSPSFPRSSEDLKGHLVTHACVQVPILLLPLKIRFHQPYISFHASNIRDITIQIHPCLFGRSILSPPDSSHHL